MTFAHVGFLYSFLKLSFRTSFHAELCLGPIWYNLQIDFSFVKWLCFLKDFHYLKFDLSAAPSLHAWKVKCVVICMFPLLTNTAYLPLVHSCHRTSVLSCESYFWAAAAFFAWAALTSVALEMPLALSCGWASGEMVETHFPGFSSLITHRIWGICPFYSVDAVLH